MNPFLLDLPRSKMLRFFSLYFLVIWLSSSLQAQLATEVYGKVTDAGTKEPLSYVNIKLMGTGRATMTDHLGEYRVRFLDKIDSLQFTYLGYKARYVKVKRNTIQEINVEMGSDDKILTEVTVKAGKKKKRQIDTTANYVFYQVLKHKEQNRIESFDSYKYDGYEKMLFSLLNAPPKFLSWKIFKPFQFAFENKDTTEQGDVFIPGLLKETQSTFYYRRKPKQLKEYVKAEKITGVNNQSVSNLAKFQFQEINPYDNLFVLAGVSFIAPFAPTGTASYFYYLTDTALLNGRVSYKLHFVGRVKEDLAMKGYAWIDSATWAIRSIYFRPNEKANFNFVNDHTIIQDYTLVNDQYWMLEREETRTVGSLFKNSNKMAILVSKINHKKNIEVNVEFPDSLMKPDGDKIVMDSARKRPVSFFDSLRHEPLTPQESRVYVIDDTFKTIPMFKVFLWTGRFLTNAFADMGPISVGRVLNFVSRNNVEGLRLRFGFETNPRWRQYQYPDGFLRQFFFSGYFAYGMKDKDWKYLALTRINLPRKNDKWQSLEFMYRYDMRVPGQDENSNLLTFDNVFNLISGATLGRIMKVSEFRISYEKEFFRGFSSSLTFNEKTYFDIPGVFNFSRKVGDQMVNVPKFNVSEFMIDTRYSYKDQYTWGVFFRYFQNTKYPVFMLRYTLGLVSMQKNFYNYHNLHFNYKQRVSSPAGITYVNFRIAKIFGRVPYTAAYITQGNYGILLDKYNYNLLREFEFVSDQYASFWLEHHFNGFFFNRIPYFNKLKLREVVIFKSLIGTFNKKNNEVLQVPGELSSPFPIPYVEMGFGIENIAYVLRVDFLWRVTYRDRPDVKTWGIKLGLNPRF
ncbi:MAG: carboxypeptidase-like regulatory domain-containing protein [Bacteroidetes bacterium]|nr:carboxypeptidase-like regulatory domain-containing protein [Bacteroidota bacterium]